MNYKRAIFSGYFVHHESKMKFTDLFDIKKKVFLESSKFEKKIDDTEIYFCPEQFYLMDGRNKKNLFNLDIKIDKKLKQHYKRDLKDFKSSFPIKMSIPKVLKIVLIFLYFYRNRKKKLINKKLSVLNKTKIFYQSLLYVKNYDINSMDSDLKLRLFLFRMKFLSGYLYTKELIEELNLDQTDIVVFWGKEYTSKMFFIDILEEKKIDYYIAEYGEIPGTISCNKKGIFGSSYSALNWKKFNDLPIDEDDISYTKEILNVIKKNQISTKNYASNFYFLIKYYYDNCLKVDEKDRKKIIYVNGVELFASGLYFNQAHIENKGKNPNKVLLEKVVSYFDEENYLILYKDHPMSKKSNPNEVLCNGDFPSVNFIDDFNIHDVLSMADYVVSYPSKVVMTSIMYNKKTFVLGDFSIPESIPSLNYFISRDFNDIKHMLDNNVQFSDLAFINYVARMIKYFLLIYDTKLFYKSSEKEEFLKLENLLKIQKEEI